MLRTLIQPPYAEQASMVIEATLEDEDGVAVPGTSLYSLKLTLYDKRTGTVINSRSQQNVLGANGGSVNSLGLMRLLLNPADAVLQTQGLIKEQHVALIEWAWAGGARSGKHEVEFTIKNLKKVT